MTGRKKLDINVFWERVKKVHGDRYDYSRVNYVTAKVKIEIVCREHGPFMQTPEKHWSGSGCAACYAESRIAKPRACRRNPGWRDDPYHCYLHGKFDEADGSHGCPKCVDEFVERAMLVHGTTYDYSRAVYVKAKEPIEIICQDHGAFWQTPNTHLAGSGCPYCSRDARTGNKQQRRDKFLREAFAAHGDIYTYSRMEYRGRKNDVTVTCSEHGDFVVNAGSHARGKGCPRCKPKVRTITKRDRSKSFWRMIGQARRLHGGRYDYSMAEYDKAGTEILVICPKHGAFTVGVKDHLAGKGCPGCESRAVSAYTPVDMACYR